jgi:SpoVK/Ycf46/Vps4 family AAA+-type ATPase
MRDQDVNLYGFQRLRAEFGAFVDETDSVPSHTQRDLLGERYRRMLGELTRIVNYQWRRGLSQSALKGFLLHGGVGLGKTSMAKRLTYELCRVFGDAGPDSGRSDEVVLVLVDGADVARSKYGESEEHLRDIFAYARSGETHGYFSGAQRTPTRYCVLLFDDAESLLLSRSASGAKEWHFAQNSVFFHNVDELDTSRTIMVLTTNRLDLVDAAIVDRFQAYEFTDPPTDVLEQIACARARLQGLAGSDLDAVIDEICTSGRVKSVRDVERLVMRRYIAAALA